MDQVVADGDDLAPRPRSTATPRPTSPSSARASPALDGLPPAARRPGPARGRGRARRSPGSARAGATAAGARRCSRRARPSWPAGTAAPPPLAMGAAMRDTVDEVGKAVAEEGIACDWVKGGTIALARTPVQLRRARADGGLPRRRRRRRRCVGATRGARARRTRRTARGSSPRGSCGGSRGPSSAAARASTSHHGHRGRAAAGGDRPRRRHARARSCGPPRPGRRSSRRARSVPVYSLIVATRPLPRRSGTRRGSRAGRRSPTTAT